MAVGDLSDMLARIKAVLPRAWFPDTTPVLDALLSGLASTWSALYQLLQYVNAQTRIKTASDVFLDVIAKDFFGNTLQRRRDEPDFVYRARISRNLLSPKATRPALENILMQITGRTPIIFEPMRPADTGCYDGPALAYGQAGGWGSLNLPNQFFLTAFRPQEDGIANVAGYGCCGGYGVGATEYVDFTMISNEVTDQEIITAVANALPAASIAWMRISN
jgi:hypothetical protein